jgi:hypothetical protein
MKKLNIATAVAVLAMGITQQAAHADIYTSVSSGSGNLTSPSGPSPVAVSYDVILDSSDSTYTYVYSFTAFSGANINDFSVNASYVSSVLGNGASLAALSLPGAFGSTVTGFYNTVSSSTSTVVWNFADAGQPTLETVAFTSLVGPTAGTGSLIDGTSGPWGDNPGAGGSPIPVPGVPEASTIVAGALMLLPLGIGAVRSLRKERAA